MTATNTTNDDNSQQQPLMELGLFLFVLAVPWFAALGGGNNKASVGRIIKQVIERTGDGSAWATVEFDKNKKGEVQEHDQEKDKKDNNKNKKKYLRSMFEPKN
jgi:hypothetical protein